MYHPHYYSLRGSEVDDENGKDEIYLSDYSLLYRIITQIYLLLSIQVLILVLAAPGPVVVRGIHEARNDDLEMGPAENVATMPNEPGEVEAASDRPASPPPSPNAMVSLEHLPSLDGSTSSGYPTPHLSESSSVSGNSWMLERPPRLSPHNPQPTLKGLGLSHNLHNSEATPFEFLPPDNAGFYKAAAAFVLSVGIFSGALWGLGKLSPNDSD
jgi:hypothetical protein